MPRGELSTQLNSFMSESLNTSQRSAVTQPHGSMLVIAGAGSGKTRVITTRLMYLMIEQHVMPHEIVALTFTNKAAREMKERIYSFIGKEVPLPFIGTFHSYCLGLLKTNQQFLPFDSFSIMDQDDQHKLLHQIIQRSGLHKQITARQASHVISQVKNHQHDFSYLPNERIYKELYHSYEREKHMCHSFDFDDLLLEAKTLFDIDTFAEKIHNTIKHVLVDEYQDTNMVQHTLLKQLAFKKDRSYAVDSVCVVGDEDQSIYSWRGATVDNIMSFTNDFPTSTVIKIEQNYRSSQPILETANHVIQHNQYRNPKKLWSERKGSDRVRIASFFSEYAEADAITHAIRSAKPHYTRAQIAILYRTHYQSRAIEEALLKESIPYTIFGGVQFYERREIKDVLAYLKLMVNPFDRVSFFRVINTPTRGLGKKCEELIHEVWREQPLLNAHQVIDHVVPHLTPSRAQSLKHFAHMVPQYDSAQSAQDVLAQLLKKNEYLSFLKQSYPPQEAQERIDNVKELIHAFEHFHTKGTTTVTGVLDEIALLQEKIHKDKGEKDTVSLMTVHGAKGLEFEFIILAGLEEGIFPSNRSLHEARSLEEERRLFYVGITRAKDHLLIIHSRYRNTYGSQETQAPSRFLDELPKHHVQRADGSFWRRSEMTSYFKQWFDPNYQPTAPVITFGPPPTYLSKKGPALEKKNIKKPATLIKPHQPIKHKTFGLGIVKKVEKKGSKTVVTAQFNGVTKKIDASFIEAV